MKPLFPPPPSRPDAIQKVMCTGCGKVEVWVGADGRTYDPVVGAECFHVENTPRAADGSRLFRCWQCTDDVLQGELLTLSRLHVLEPVALPNGDIFYRILPPVSERTEGERAELERMGILQVLAGWWRRDPDAIARIGSNEFTHLPLRSPRPATPEEIAEKMKSAGDRFKSPRVLGS
jgi:hypothetical protein